MKEIYRNLPPSGIRSIYDRTKELEGEGRKILHLDVGLPIWHLPPGAQQGLKAALVEGFNQYTENRGLLELRELISEGLIELNGTRYDPEKELIVTAGATEGIAIAALAMLGPGDEIIIPQPAWNHYETLARIAGAKPVYLNLSIENKFQIDPDQLQKLVNSKTKMIVVNSPSNPTGVVQLKENLKRVAEIALKNGIYVLSDDVYDRFVYHETYWSMCKFMGDSELLIYVNSFSKTFAMTGWRLGMVAAKPKVSNAINKIHQYLTVCSTSLLQKASINILKHPELKKYREQTTTAFQERADFWNEALKKCSALQYVPPTGAFYLFPQLNYKGMNGSDFCKLMLEEHSTALVPGEAFGEAFRQYFRISFGADMETQRAAAKIILEVLS